MKVGDKVRVLRCDNSKAEYGRTGTVVLVASPVVTVSFPSAPGWASALGEHCWRFFYPDTSLQLVSGPSIADDLNLYPQDRTVLAHLKSGKAITPMKALVVYGLSRLAAHIHNIRKIGYTVTKTMATDESGHKYASYKLVIN